MRYLSILTFVCLLCISCTDEHKKPQEYINIISHNLISKNIDSLNIIRDELSQDENSETRKNLYLCAKDSSENLKAMILILTCRPESVADTLLSHPSLEMSQAIRQAYNMLNEQDNFNTFTVSLQKKFNTLPVSDQAIMLTSFLPPEKIAKGIESKDAELIQEIKKVYSTDKQKLQKFISNIPANNQKQ